MGYTVFTTIPGTPSHCECQVYCYHSRETNVIRLHIQNAVRSNFVPARLFTTHRANSLIIIIKGGYRICERGGGGGGGGQYYTLPEAVHREFFRLHCSLNRIGSRSTFVLCTASSEDCRSQGRHVLLSCSNFTHERTSNLICTYTEGVY